MPPFICFCHFPMNISISHLRKSFGDVVALNSIDLEIADGELFFLLGPSGCGKTTLLRCIGGFELPTSGTICFDGADVSRKAPNERNTAMVFQGYALWPHMTVFENVAFGLQMQKLSKEEIARRVKTALESVDIWNCRDRKPNELSGGQQQRVALARTLVVEPGCMLLDEPLANLDAKLRRDMRSEIRNLCKERHLTAIYVTHDRSEALTMADRMAVLKDGVIVQLGTPREIYRNPRNAFVATFMGEANILKGKLLSDGRLETSCGALAVADSVKTPEVELMIRPEAISLTPHHGSTNENVLEGKVLSCEYLGEVAKLRASTGQGVLEFLELNPLEATAEGTSVKLHISATDVRVLSEASGESDHR